MCFFKNTDLNNICASIVFKAKTKDKIWRNIFRRFLFQNFKMHFFGGQPIFCFFSHFFWFSFKNNTVQCTYMSKRSCPHFENAPYIAGGVGQFWIVLECTGYTFYNIVHLLHIVSTPLYITVGREESCFCKYSIR